MSDVDLDTALNEAEEAEARAVCHHRLFGDIRKLLWKAGALDEE